MTRPDALELAYEPPAGGYDELLAAPGEPRPHWTPIVRSLEGLGRAELERRWSGAQRLIEENGVTYNVYGDPRGRDRPWELDPFPLLIASDTWASLSAGLAQRARLLGAILADLYGRQRLLRQDLLPPELVFGHPTYLRACHGMRPPAGRWLHLYAADLARAPDGRWWVLGDRTQAPSGVGYALENRIVLSRTLHEAFRDSRVERLAGFFQHVRETLRCLSPRPVDSPRIVLLTPGPWNETYFEHAYLARYLGFTLVEGGDLTVRDRMLYLKTLGGLERIDVVLRRVDDVFCDPLSLRGDSSLGVPGLVHAVRAGNVAVVNALGSGLVEMPALLAFLPRLCKALLGEELQLPSVATWWCGHEEALAYTLAHLPELVIKPTFPATGRAPVFGDRISTEERDALVARLRARPGDFVAQEQVALSTAPVWNGERAQPRPVVLRTYAAASSGDTWQIMPGGLTRVSLEPDSLVVSMQSGGGSKDTWVCSEGLPAEISLLRPAGAHIALQRGGAELPSRVADDLFWLARYLERIEGATRMARTAIGRMADERAGAGHELVPLLTALMRHAGPSEADPTDAAAAIAALFSYDGPSSLRATLRTVHQLAFSLRDQLSMDTWRMLSELQREVSASGAADDLSAAAAALNRMLMRLAAWSGLAMESMTRTLGWRFADMGRRIERASHAAGLLSTCLVSVKPDEGPLLEALLETGESSITYRRRYRGELHTEAVLDLLLCDETNPRSVAFQLAALNEHVAHLPAVGEGARLREEQRIALGMLTRLRLADVADLARIDDGKRLRLEEHLARCVDELPALSDALTRQYLSHAGNLSRTV